MPNLARCIGIFAVTLCLGQWAAAQEPATPSGPPSTDTISPASEANLAKELSNPVASLISVPFQNNFDYGMGPNGNGFRYTLNIQPVVPFALNKDWNLISRTIVPIVAQSNVIGTTTQGGISDTVQSFFISPDKTTPFIWGVGPALLIPTATRYLLGTQKFGIGPTAVVLKQQGGLTYGMLLNHLWSVAGAHNRADVSSTFLQPFVSYTTKSLWTYTVQTESTYDWTASKWSVPIVLAASKLLIVDKKPISVGGAIRCWAASPAGAPQDCGFRVSVTPLFPTKQ